MKSIRSIRRSQFQQKFHRRFLLSAVMDRKRKRDDDPLEDTKPPAQRQRIVGRSSEVQPSLNNPAREITTAASLTTTAGENQPADNWTLEEVDKLCDLVKAELRENQDVITFSRVSSHLQGKGPLDCFKQSSSFLSNLNITGIFIQGPGKAISFFDKRVHRNDGQDDVARHAVAMIEEKWTPGAEEMVQELIVTHRTEENIFDSRIYAYQVPDDFPGSLSVLDFFEKWLSLPGSSYLMPRITAIDVCVHGNRSTLLAEPPTPENDESHQEENVPGVSSPTPSSIHQFTMSPTTPLLTMHAQNSRERTDDGPSESSQDETSSVTDELNNFSLGPRPTMDTPVETLAGVREITTFGNPAEADGETGEIAADNDRTFEPDAGTEENVADNDRTFESENTEDPVGDGETEESVADNDRTFGLETAEAPVDDGQTEENVPENSRTFEVETAEAPVEEDDDSNMHPGSYSDTGAATEGSPSDDADNATGSAPVEALDDEVFDTNVREDNFGDDVVLEQGPVNSTARKIGLRIQCLVMLMVTFLLIWVMKMRKNPSANVVTLDFPPCFLPSVEERGDDEAVIGWCSRFEERLPCPLGGICSSSGALHSCLDAFRHVSENGDQCILSSAFNNTMAELEAALVRLTAEHYCTVTGGRLGDKIDTKAPSFDVSLLLDNAIVLERLALEPSDSLIFHTELNGTTMVGLTELYLASHSVIPLWCRSRVAFVRFLESIEEPAMRAQLSVWHLLKSHPLSVAVSIVLFACGYRWWLAKQSDRAHP